MGDVLKVSTEASFRLTMENSAHETTTRSLALPCSGSSSRTALLSLRSSLLAAPFNTFLQPTGWRDDNDSENFWTTTGCEIVIVEKRETTIDPTATRTDGEG